MRYTDWTGLRQEILQGVTYTKNWIRNTIPPEKAIASSAGDAETEGQILTDRREIIPSDRMLKKVENSGIVSGEEVQNTDNGNAEWPSELQNDFIDIERQANNELTAD